MTTPIIIDCDPGHDDAVAIMLAVASPLIDLRAVTTVAGNTTLEKTTANAIRILDLVGQDTPVGAGADRPLVRDLVVAEYVHGPSGLDGPELQPPSRGPGSLRAVDLIARTLDESDRPVTLVPMGPLTNIALFLAVYPELVGKIERIVLMGGSIGMGNVTPAAEFNIYVDPEAAARVFASGLDVTMVGLDVTLQALLRRPDAERLAGGGKVARFVSELFGFFSQHEPGGRAMDGAPIHDAAAVAHVIWPDLIRTEQRAVIIDLSDAQRGRTIVDRRPGVPESGTVSVATEIDGGRFTSLLVEHIESLG
jgi:inosine-uridine nucleoside N-ribohydrolase